MMSASGRKTGAMLWICFVFLAMLLQLPPSDRGEIGPYDGRENLHCVMAWSPLAGIRSRVNSKVTPRSLSRLPSSPVSAFCTTTFTTRRFQSRTSSLEIEEADASSVPCPEGLSYLPFQSEVILDSIIPSTCDGRKGILLADEMGLGKTVSIIGGINYLLRDHYNVSSSSNPRRFKALIVAPKSVLSHWEHELHRWIVLPPNAIATRKEEITSKKKDSRNKKANPKKKENDETTNLQVGTITAKNGVPKEDCDIYLINYEIVGKYLKDLLDLFGTDKDKTSDNHNKILDVLVCDECHYLKSVDSQRTHATLGHHRHSASQPGVAAMAERLWLVTGSPILNNPLELFPLLNSLTKTDDPKDANANSNPTLEAFPEVASLEAFRDRYCGRQETPWGVTYKGGKNLSELRKRLIQPLVSENGTASTTPLMVRRTKQQVLPELPDKRHQLFPLDDGGIAASEEFDLLETVLKGGANNNNGNDSEGLEVYLNGLKVVDLKELCKERGLLVGGRKSELIERLVRSDAKGILNNDADEEEDSIKPMEGEETENTEGSILFPSRGSQNAEINLESSALSVLQSAPNENRRQILKDLLTVPKIAGAKDRELGGNALLGGLGRARHQTALRKVPYVIELLEIALLSHKVVVFAHHRDVQEIIFQHFQDQAVALNGDTPPEDRMKNVQAFQNDPSIKLFVGSIRASGLGITLTAASHVVFVEMDWSPSIIQQAEDRCHRVGQKASVLVQYIYFKGTIDEHLSQLLVEKQRTLSAAIEEIPEGSAAGWVFDFGKHSGQMIADVAAEDPDYLKWLVEKKIYIDRRKTSRKSRTEASSDSDETDGLTEGLVELGFLKPKDKNLPVEWKNYNDADHRSMISQPEYEEATDHVIKFGKHSGKRLKEIPRQYLEWVLNEGVSKDKPGLTEALQIYLAGSSPSDSQKNWFVDSKTKPSSSEYKDFWSRSKKSK